MQKARLEYPSFALVLTTKSQIHTAWLGQRVRCELREAFSRLRRKSMLEDDLSDCSTIIIDRDPIPFNYTTQNVLEQNIPDNQLAPPVLENVALHPSDDDVASIISFLDLEDRNDETRIHDNKGRFYRLFKILRETFLSQFLGLHNKL